MKAKTFNQAKRQEKMSVSHIMNTGFYAEPVGDAVTKFNSRNQKKRKMSR